MVSEISPATLSAHGPSSEVDDPVRRVARDLQVTFFKDMLQYGGFAEAFSTGSDTLDSFTSVVLEQVALDMAVQDPTLADYFYRQISAGS